MLRGVFSGYSGFPPSTKTNIFKFQFDLETVERRATPWIPLKFPFIFIIFNYKHKHNKTTTLATINTENNVIKNVVKKTLEYDAPFSVENDNTTDN